MSFLLCSLVVSFLFVGCVVTQQSAEDVRRKFKEGIQGRGQIVPNDPTQDNFGPEFR